ncbi:putative peroxin 14 [Trypanosoma cruzi]|uniref:Peroxisomal membrane protein PEX14 n=2 Tax=Trypanosoma cruzi TaxID=5693 RepID=Q4D1H5_TRYCC|nr:peroxin 14, putative [Trypanosoma cruzi]EAN86372.1 peroxin 14, putative [Trypanosoma cruzi]PWV09286.1 putative peroxin 14 [Trypanosoma cruzi]RNC55913.1 putative peroxin 14 [Trypanosoma cruzi]|eukprot:XP_808223.1 peroxin 14 [Trypanosoma cruzi strain CL Brener]
MNTATTVGVTGDGDARQRNSPEESEKRKRVSSAVQFLHDSRVKITPAANKIQFLKSKGLTTEEVCEAFEKAGQTIPLDEIKKIMNKPSFGQLGSGVVNNNLAPGHVGSDATYVLRQHPFMPHAGPLYTQQPPPFPQTPQGAKETDWRDVIIGVGAALISGFAAFKAFQIYSPYEIRRKDERTKKGSRMESQRRGKRHEGSVSPDRGAERPVTSLHTMAPPMPATPTPLPTATAANAAESTEREIQKLQSELKETQEALEKEKRSKAEISVSLGKLRGQINALSRTNDNLESRIKLLQEEVDKANSEANKRKELDASFTGAADGVPKSQSEDAIQPNGPPLLTPKILADTVGCNSAALNELPVLTAVEFVPEE